MNTVSDEILPFKRTEVLGRNITDLVRQGLVEEPIILNMLKVKKRFIEISFTQMGSLLHIQQFQDGILRKTYRRSTNRKRYFKGY